MLLKRTRTKRRGARDEEDDASAVFDASVNDRFVEKNTNPLTYAERKEINSNRTAAIEELPDMEIISTMISVYSEQEIERISRVDITDPDITNPRLAASKSLYDSVMGTITSDTKCSTCNDYDCFGHYGRILFASPIPHPLWMNTIRDLLTIVCNSCGKLLKSKKAIELNGWQYLSAQKKISTIAKSMKKEKCQRDNSCPDIADGKIIPCRRNPTYLALRADEKFKIMYTIGKDKNEYPIEIERILAIFRSISKEDAETLGFINDSRPEDLIMQSLLVMPPGSRIPYVSGGVHRADDLTEGYKKIVVCANELMLFPKNGEIKNSLYLRVKELMEGKKQKFQNAAKFMSIASRLQGKAAIPRSGLMGKRVNFCARTVIGPDTSLKFDQLRVPVEWAPKLTYPETVREDNIDYLKSLIHNGKASMVRRLVNGRLTYPHAVLPDTVINLGDVVFRHMQNGDIVIFNRQPTLSKASMMAFEVVLGKERTIGLHLSYTTPTNADFDGDEVNLWVPQTAEAIAEAMVLLNVNRNLSSPSNNSPTMGIVYDALTSSHLLTRESKIREDVYYDLLTYVTNTEDMATIDQRLRRYNINKYSGRAIFSNLLPDDLFYSKGNLLIIDGVLVQGEITGSHIGPKGHTIIEALAQNYGSARTSQFLTDASFMLLRYITIRGHTIGIKDCMAIDTFEHQKEVEQNRKAVASLQSKIDALGDIPQDKAGRELYDKRVGAMIKASDEQGFSEIKRKVKDPSNNMGAMVADLGAGTKGKLFNVKQIRGRVGQQYFKGEPLKANCGNRLLPGFDENDLDVRARGYIPNSFMSADITPEEHFMIMMGGRQGLIDTAVNVAVMGDIHRKIVKALENLMIGESRAVVNPSGAVFQLAYGGDGLNPAKLISVKPPGTELDSVPTFVDIFALANNLNVKSNYVPGFEISVVISREKSVTEKDLVMFYVPETYWPEDYFIRVPLNKITKARKVEKQNKDIEDYAYQNNLAIRNVANKEITFIPNYLDSIEKEQNLFELRLEKDVLTFNYMSFGDTNEEFDKKKDYFKTLVGNEVYLNDSKYVVFESISK
jgi:DNA-directed RNA polymerase II subunit RPB1